MVLLSSWIIITVKKENILFFREIISVLCRSQTKQNRWQAKYINKIEVEEKSTQKNDDRHCQATKML